MGTVKAIAGILAIIFVVYAGFQIIPPEMSNYSFEDDLHNIAMMAGANLHQSDQETLDAVLKKAREHDIPLTPEQVTVQRMNAAGGVAVYVAADYNVPVSFPGYSFTLHFTPNSGNKGF
jgi:nucleotide-binding universal stress UspA family protein